ncbi:HAD-IA family hydrolase [Asanoa sp. NPDC049518]|uniref:HAD family hydrolase n=1 Tax=unclassified Asanoa TaxID=2685164 RepID=UPI003434DE31
MTVNALVFDFDGLLMDTETTMVEGWRAAWAQHGLTLDLDDGFWPGHGGDVTAHRLDRLAALVGPTFDRGVGHRAYEAHRARLNGSLPLRPGVAEWLSAARDAGVALAVASSSPRSWVREHLTRAGVFDHFDTIATGDEVADHKPDPAVYHLALRRLGVPAHEAAAVEDTPHGLAAARAAGMRTVGIPNPFVPATALAAADLVLASAADLPLKDLLTRLA